MTPSFATDRARSAAGSSPALRPRPLPVSDGTKARRRGVPVVYLAGGLTALDAPGGGEIQMSSLARALPAAGVEARFWRPWEDALAEADCLHLFGSLPGHLPVIEAARRKEVPVALSTIAWFDWANCWRETGSVVRRSLKAGRFLLRALCPHMPSWRRRLYQSVDLLMPNSQAEAEQLMRLFGVPPGRIRVVPNGADGRFAAADPALFVERFGLRQFVLYPGRIEPRKNQLGFLRAMRDVSVPIVVLGDPVPGHETYYAACRRAAGRNVRFLGRLDHGDPLLASALAACGCMVLASWYETPGLVALEAGMTGTPLVLPVGGCAREYFGPLAAYVPPNHPAGLRRAVVAALTRGRSPELAELVRNHFSWEKAAAVTREAYESILE